MCFVSALLSAIPRITILLFPLCASPLHNRRTTTTVLSPFHVIIKIPHIHGYGTNVTGPEQYLYFNQTDLTLLRKWLSINNVGCDGRRLYLYLSPVAEEQSPVHGDNIPLPRTRRLSRLSRDRSISSINNDHADLADEEKEGDRGRENEDESPLRFSRYMRGSGELVKEEEARERWHRVQGTVVPWHDF